MNFRVIAYFLIAFIFSESLNFHSLHTFKNSSQPLFIFRSPKKGLEFLLVEYFPSENYSAKFRSPNSNLASNQFQLLTRVSSKLELIFVRWPLEY